MHDEKGGLLENLTTLSRYDSTLVAINGDMKRAQAEADQKKSEARRVYEEHEKRRKALLEKQERYGKEERAIKEESDKLVNRRKALGTFTNYKVAQGAEKEIEQAAKLLRVREDALLGVMEEVEKLERHRKEAEDAYRKLVAEYDQLAKRLSEEFPALEERRARVSGEREALAKQIEATHLTVYERVKQKFPVDPVAPVRAGACGGCFMHVGPQTINEIHRGSALVKCPGCGRILYLEKGEAHP